MSFTRRVLVTFNTEHLANKDKVRFFYAFKGRGTQKGLVETTRAEHLGPGVLLAAQEHKQTIEAFLQYWKCQHKLIIVDVEEEATRNY